MVSIFNGLPVWDSVGKLLIRDAHPIELLPFLYFDFDFVVFKKVSKLLCKTSDTLESTQPFFIPYLFIATKSFPGSLISDTLWFSHPLTTE